MNEELVAGLFDKWNQALLSKDPDCVVALYAPDAILHPTLSNEVRHNHAEIRDYFVHFIAKDPVGVINEANLREINGVLINSGVYTFTLGDSTSVRARFTYVYRQCDGEWLIVVHHSSLVPE